MSPASEATRAEALRLTLIASSDAATLDGAWAADKWNAARLGVRARREHVAVRFDTITQEWLREPVKRWSRFRLATGCAFSTISCGALALARFSRFLTEHHPEVSDPAGITRPVLEDYLAWLLTQGYSSATRAWVRDGFVGGWSGTV